MATQGEIKTEGSGLGNIQAPALVLGKAETRSYAAH